MSSDDHPMHEQLLINGSYVSSVKMLQLCSSWSFVFLDLLGATSWPTFDFSHFSSFYDPTHCPTYVYNEDSRTRNIVQLMSVRQRHSLTQCATYVCTMKTQAHTTYACTLSHPHTVHLMLHLNGVNEKKTTTIVMVVSRNYQMCSFCYITTIFWAWLWQRALIFQFARLNLVSGSWKILRGKNQ
jgi:hypothetical protein